MCCACPRTDLLIMRLDGHADSLTALPTEGCRFVQRLE